MTYNDITLPSFDAAGLSRTVIADLRSDHAGETGAVAIYEGMLRVARDRELRVFAVTHLATEQAHLALLDSWLPRTRHSKLLPLWRVSGWLLGAFAGLFGRRFGYLTISAVEQFVISHYAEQLTRTDGPVRALLTALQLDEAQHQQDAEQRLGQGGESLIERLWTGIVWRGSAAAVALARVV